MPMQLDITLSCNRLGRRFREAAKSTLFLSASCL